MGKSASAPDYTGAAQAQGASSAQVTNMQTWANRPDMQTPWGSMTWNPTATTDPATGQQVTQWQGNLALNPTEQQALDSQQQIQQGRSDMAQNLISSADAAISQPFSFGSANDARQAGQDAIYGQMTSRLDPQWGQRENAERSYLANQGLDMNDEAYQTEMGNFNRARNDAYNQAGYQSVIGGQGMAQSQMGLEQMQRTLPLNLMNAALTGQQVQNPQMPNFAQAGAAQPVNYLGAATAQGNFGLSNADMQNQFMGQMMGGAGNLGGAAMLAFSDERLKENIHRSDEEALPGVPFASWEYKHDPRHRRFKGVIAQDVERYYPGKVHSGPGGFKMVDGDLAPFSFGKGRN